MLESPQPATNVPLVPSNRLPPQPFGLPMGSVRGIMALLILSFFWLAIIWPNPIAKLPLGHFFLLPLVFSSFAIAGADGRPASYRPLPAVLRLLVILGTGAAAFWVYTRGVENFESRLTPDPQEFRENWLTFSLILACGFLAGHFFRLLFGQRSAVFVTVRAWISVLALVMLLSELILLVLLLSTKSGDNAFSDFMRNFQFFEVAIVSAYFGTRV